MRFAWALLIAIIAMAPNPAAALESERADQSSFLTRAVFTDGQLWLLSDAGELSVITEGVDKRVRIDLPEPALDLCLQGGRPLIVTGDRRRPGTWTARHWAEGAWSTKAKVKSDGDSFLALDCSSERATILTTRRLIKISDQSASTIDLSDDLSPSGVVAVHGTRDWIFVGFNRGEWGGGLLRLDRRTGIVSKIERNLTGALCGGPLNASCDPVNAIVSEPWKPDCIAAAIGLVHFEPSGRIVTVCGNRVERLYYKHYGSSQDRNPAYDDFNTVAFFGLASDGAALWAVGIDGIYNVKKDGTAESIPLPPFHDVDGVRVSFAEPRFVLVLTNVNQRRSVSGSVPLLVPR